MKWKFLIGCWRISTNEKVVSQPNTPNKMNHTKWKSMKNCAQKWCQKLCAFLFEVTCDFGKLWLHVWLHDGITFGIHPLYFSIYQDWFWAYLLNLWSLNNKYVHSLLYVYSVHIPTVINVFLWVTSDCKSSLGDRILYNRENVLWHGLFCTMV